MSFLDDVPLDWARPEVQQLRDLFVLAYKHPYEAEQLTASAGIAPGTFPTQGNMRNIWREAIIEMSNQGRLRTLVEKAAADPTVAAFQPRFAEMLQGQPSVPVPAPKTGADWWKGDDRDPALAAKLYQERLIEQRSRLIHIEIARQVGEISRSVAKLDLRFANDLGHGTGFLIQPDLILTNHHNVSDDEFGDVQSLVAEFDYEEGFDQKLKPLVRKGMTKSIKKNKEHDWAVIQLEKPVDRNPIPLGTEYDVGRNDPIIIIEHPLGAFKQFALDMRSIQYVDDRIVQYLADTQKGSSGAPVFNIKMQVIALHHAEAEVTVHVDGKDEVEWRNEGIRIEQVMNDLDKANIKYIHN